MAYIGKEPTVGNFQVCDAISVVNGQAAYTMQVSSTNVTPESANHMLVSLNGILQKPNSSFTVSGSTITFASNLATGDVIDFIMLLGNVLDIGTPSDSTVTDAKANFVSTSSAAGLQIKGDGTTDGTLQLNCSQNSHGIKIASPAHSAGQSYKLIFPAGNVTAGKFLKVDSVSGSGTTGIGTMTFADAGGANTPAFFAHQGGSSAQSISHNTSTKIQCDTEIFDSDSAYDNSSNYRFTPQTAGKYFIFASIMLATADDMNQLECRIYKNGSSYTSQIGINDNYNNVSVSTIVDMNGSSDYVECYIHQNVGATKNTYPSNNEKYVRFGGYRIIT
jgi:hypothetical protein